MPRSRHLLSWDQPLLRQVAERLLAAAGERGGPADLSATLVIVPTRQSGRRLREALAHAAADRGPAFFPPRIVPPDYLLTYAPPANAAGRAGRLLAWAAVLRAADLGAARALFPIDPPARDFAWALPLAEQLLDLQTELAEQGLTFADVAVSTRQANAYEPDRWACLAELAARQQSRLAAAGLADPVAAMLRHAADPAPPPGIARLVLAGTPDPVPLGLRVLEKLSAQLPVEILFSGPPGGESLFDDWGRPRTAAFQSRAIPVDTAAAPVRLAADPAAVAADLAALAARHGAADGRLAFGLADPEITPLLARRLAAAGLAAYDPAGRPATQSALGALLQTLGALLPAANFRAAADLCRQPDFAGWLRRLAPDSHDWSDLRLRHGFDCLAATHLPDSLDDARELATDEWKNKFPEAPAALDALTGVRRRLAAGAFAETLPALLRDIYGPRQFFPHEPDDRALIDSAESLQAVLAEIRRAAPAHPELAPADWNTLLLRLASAARLYSDRPAAAYDLQGWLELLWEDAPHLALGGLNDGAVPEAVVGHAFLPESLRVHLGLRTNETRFARDAYLLEALLAMRASNGRVELFVAKTALTGEPRPPSRLLFRCPDDRLVVRAQTLFREPPAAAPRPPWQAAWQLRPGKPAPPERLSVTGFGVYLRCPFRFFLQRRLRMEPFDAARRDLDAREFGTLCHEALQALGTDGAAKSATQAIDIAAFLTDHVRAAMRQRYGRRLPLPLELQLDSACARLEAAARVEAEARAQGWRIFAVEQEWTAEIDGLTITGKIDRIDRHETTGAWRLLDYKTSDKAVAPARAHLRNLPRAGRPPHLPACAETAATGKLQLWTSLQLPLYRRFWRAQNSGDPPACGYFNLPKNTGETGIDPWSDLTPEAEESAWVCARGIVAAIRAGRFWPPAPLKPDEDEFARLFPGGLLRAVDPVEISAAIP